MREKNSRPKSNIRKDIPIERRKERVDGMGWSERSKENQEEHSLLKTRPERIMRKGRLYGSERGAPQGGCTQHKTELLSSFPFVFNYQNGNVFL